MIVDPWDALDMGLKQSPTWMSAEPVFIEYHPKGLEDAEDMEEV
jgi:hypothetical protein